MHILYIYCPCMIWCSVHSELTYDSWLRAPMREVIKSTTTFTHLRKIYKYFFGWKTVQILRKLVFGGVDRMNEFYQKLASQSQHRTVSSQHPASLSSSPGPVQIIAWINCSSHLLAAGHSKHDCNSPSSSYLEEKFCCTHGTEAKVWITAKWLNVATLTCLHQNY